MKIQRHETSSSRAFRRAVFVQIAVLAFVAPSVAATITWGLPQDISGDSDVSTTGTFVAAYSLGAAGVADKTVNGVTFTGVVDTASPTVFGNFSITGPSSGGNNFYTPGPFGFSASYEALLSSAISSFALPFTLTMSNLVPGTTYEFQWWVNENNLSGTNTVATAGNAVNLHSENGPYANLLYLPGHFAIGTFVADATTIQTIDFSSPFFVQLNAFQLRQLSSVPEGASSFALLAIGLLSLAAFRCARSTRESPF